MADPRSTHLALRLRETRYRARESLLFLPLLLVLGGAVAAVVMTRLDEHVDPSHLPRLLRLPPSVATTFLGTIAGATITTAGVVFSITVVSVQLASAQFSPRVLRNFFRDRVGQAVIGLLVATFTYAVVALFAIEGGDDSARPGLSVAGALVMSLAAILMIVVYFDHSARTLYVGEVARRVQEETCGVIDDVRQRLVSRQALTTPLDEAQRAAVERLGDPGQVAGRDDADPVLGTAFRVPAPTDGWVQQLSSDGILRALPPGSVARLETRAGAYVVRDSWLVSVWPAPAEHERAQVCRDVHAAVVVGSQRTTQQDVDFGIRQLVDIGLRALSPAINDPTTAIEMALRLSSVLDRLLRTDLPSQVRTGPDGSLLLRPWDLDHGEYVRHAYDQLRQAATQHPAVLVTLLRTARLLSLVAREEGRSGAEEELRRQTRLVVAGAERAGLLEEDLAQVRAVAGPQAGRSPSRR